MAEFTNNPVQLVQPNQVVTLQTTIGCPKGYVLHRNGSGIVTIQELEQEPTSFENCNTLASLYICREINKNRNMSLLDTSESVSHDNSYIELADILPAYIRYVDTKKRYQQFEVVDKMLIYAMEDVCKELVEFIADLYHNTETTAERTLIIDMINNLRSAI